MGAFLPYRVPTGEDCFGSRADDARASCHRLKGRIARLQGPPREGPELARKPSFHCDSDDCQVFVSQIGQDNRAVAGVAWLIRVRVVP
jgi:hypothetical protein